MSQEDCFFFYFGQQERKKAYRQLAKQHHPDKCKEENAGEVFKKIVEAYGVVKKKKEEKDDDSEEWEFNDKCHEEEHYQIIFLVVWIIQG